MRLRNIPGADEKIESSEFCVKEPASHKGEWNKVFGTDNPIHIEVGMGKGKFIMKLAEKNPDINYIGIEMYSSVLIRAISRAEEQQSAGAGNDNFRFIRMDARALPDTFAMGEIDKIYLNFSDPWPKDRHAKRRLTSTEFLRRYEQILPKGNVVEFKTDNVGLFDFSLEQAEEAGWEICGFTRNLHHDSQMNDGNIMTEYEEKFAADGIPINKMIIKNV